MSNSNQNIETPLEFVRAVERLFGIEFKYDMAATEENKKAEFCFGTHKGFKDSLTHDWPVDGWLFLNPPFKKLGLWVKKCYLEANHGAKIVSIWPLSGDQNQLPAWQGSSVFVIHGRLWPEVRGIMLCVWDTACNPPQGLRWDRKKSLLTKVW